MSREVPEKRAFQFCSPRARVFAPAQPPNSQKFTQLSTYYKEEEEEEEEEEVS